jgi:hypothetical protein
MLYLVIAIIDGAQYIRLFAGWSIEDVDARARYFWRDSNITSVEVHPTIDVTIPEPGDL